MDKGSFSHQALRALLLINFQAPRQPDYTKQNLVNPVIVRGVIVNAGDATYLCLFDSTRSLALLSRFFQAVTRMLNRDSRPPNMLHLSVFALESA